MKTDTNTSKKIKRYASEAGLTVMALATILGLVDIPEHTIRAVFITPQPSKYGNYDPNSQDPNPLLREKEENSTEYVSYSEAERTPSSSGKY